VSRDNISISQAELLSRIKSPERPVIHLKTLVIVAHPDDETFGCGALLPRLADVTVLHVTDGAPRDSVDARRSGFTHWAEYARARRCEVEQAAKIAGLPALSLKSLNIPDQIAALRLPQLTRAMLGFIAGADLVLTHAFEGEHPDHDAVAFAIGSARARMRGKAPIVLEMPFYRKAQGRDGWVRETFDGGDGAVRLELTDDERARKAEMLAVYETQRQTFADFACVTSSIASRRITISPGETCCTRPISAASSADSSPNSHAPRAVNAGSTICAANSSLSYRAVMPPAAMPRRPPSPPPSPR
jgi:N-acetylglucosamine malate deacetylase 2